jgi:hypothetical protein
VLWLLFFIIDIEHKWCKTFVNELYVLVTTQKVRVIVSQTNSSQQVDMYDDVMMMMMMNPQQQAVYCCCQCGLLSTYQTCLLIFLIFHQPNCRTKFLSFGNICMLQVLCIYNTKLQSTITLMRNVRVVKMQIVCVCVCVCEEIHT